MIEDIISELNLSQIEVSEISQLMHTNLIYHIIFGNLKAEDYSKSYEKLFRKCAYEYLRIEDF